MNALFLSENDIYKGDLILVNQHHPYHENDNVPFIPVREKSDILLKRDVVRLLSDLMEKISGWQSITPVSGWRSMKEQQAIWNQSLEENGLEFTQTYVAVPGHSEHQTGLAIDLGLRMPDIDFIRPDFPYSGICQQFRNQASEYGFIERYPRGKEAVTCIGHEPWHFRYVGIPHAIVMKEQEMVLEEYMEFLKQYPYGEKPYLHRSKGYEFKISYLKVEDRDRISLISGSAHPYLISGNNIDGFIITEIII